MSTALDVVLLNTNDPIEITAEIDSINRSTGAAKTWYFSTHLRETGASDTPANTTFLPFIRMGGTLGPLTQSLSDDILFSGLAQNSPGTITLTQTIPDSDLIFQFLDYVFAGYEVRIKIGHPTSSYSAFVTARTLIVATDPSCQTTTQGTQAVFPLSSLIGRLIQEPIITGKYVGIPHCLRLLTATGQAIVTKVAAHDVRSFTVGIKFRATSAPAVARRIFSKLISGTNTHFFFAIQTSGKATLTSTSNLAVDISFTSSLSICDGLWHTLIFSRDDSRTAYVSVDTADLTTYTPSGPTDLSNNNLNFGLSAGGDDIDLCDARFINRYMTSSEARAYFATRSSGDDLGVIGLWRFDDNGGGTANDYSPTNADAVISGVLNTDYQWTGTDLGEPEIAGRLHPVNVGAVLNAKAQLIDVFRERYRGNTDERDWHIPLLGTTSLVVRSQGTVLTGGGVDYTAPTDGGMGVFSTTSPEAEPITYDILSSGLDEQDFYPSNVARELLIARTRVPLDGVDNYLPLEVLCPWISGYWTDQETTADQALKEILGNCGLCYYESDIGHVVLNMLLPPMGYGPFGEPCLDLKGQPGNMVTWGDLADMSGSFTLACWVKVQIFDQTVYDWVSTEPNEGTIFLINKGGLSGNYALWFQAVGEDAGKLKFSTAGVTLASPAGVINSMTSWYFVASVFDTTANTMKMYIAPKGSTLVEVASTTNSGTPSTTSDGVWIGDSGEGCPWASVQYPQVWNSAKTLPQLQTIMASVPTGSESGLSFYPPINEGSGNPVDKISGTTGTVVGTPQWAPKFTVDLNVTPSVKLTEFHRTNPVGEVTIKYAKNRSPMVDADIDTGVSQNDHLKLSREWEQVVYDDLIVKSRFKYANKITLDSPLIESESALKLLRFIVSRFSTDGYIGKLTFPPGLNISRLACGLSLTDEVGLRADIPSQLSTALSFRVTSVSPNLLQLSNTVVIWRG